MSRRNNHDIARGLSTVTAKKPKPEKVRTDDMPVLVHKVVRGSNNSTRATLSAYEYPNGDVCLQLEDKKGGAEMWTHWHDLCFIFDEFLEIAKSKGAGED